MILKAFQALKQGQVIINEAEGSILVVGKRNNNHIYCSSIILQFKITKQDNIDIIADHHAKWEVYDPYKVTDQKLLNLILIKEIGQLKLFMVQQISMQHEIFHNLTHLI